MYRKEIIFDRSTTSTPGRMWIQDFLNPSGKKNEPICYGACGIQKGI